MATQQCPCGHYGGAHERCSCDPTAVRRYVGRVGGPLLDRIDLHVDVPAVPWTVLRSRSRGETSGTLAARVREARRRAARRAIGVVCNAELEAEQIEATCRVRGTAEDMLRAAVERFGLSARAYHKVLKTARTIADLAGRDDLRSDDVAEAIQYRALDRDSDWI